MSRKPDSLSASSLAVSGQYYVREVWSALSLTIRRWKMDDGSSMAAAVAYYLALSLFPMLLLLTSGLGFALRYTRLGQDAELQILSIVSEHCSPTLELQVRDVLHQLSDQSLVGGPVGMLTAVMAAIAVFYQFERAFDKIWRIPPPPPSGLGGLIARVVRERFAAFTLLAGLGLSIVLVLAANVAIGAVREWMTHWRVSGTAMVSVLDALTTVTLNALAFASLYRWLPKRSVQWRDAWRGGLLVSLTWEVGRQVLSVFLIGMRYTTAYGAIGSFIALLLWFYWGVTILLFGAEYVQVLSRRHAPPLTMFRPGQQNAQLSPAPPVPIVFADTSKKEIESETPTRSNRVKSPPRRRAA